MNESDLVRYRVTVTGWVQGVWYRESCRREAEALGVVGSVRNRSDGAVEAVVEGPSGGVEALLAWMRQGPPRARVTGLETHRETPQEAETRFAVR